MKTQVQDTDPNTRDPDVRRLKKIKISLMRDPTFALMSGIMMVGKTSLSEDCPTAMTNGRDEIYGRAFMKGLNDKELGFVIMHENYHKAYRHMTVWRKLYKENPQLANAACDYVINLNLVDLDPNQKLIAMPKKDGKTYGLLDEKYRGMNTKQIYDLLKKECKGGQGGKGKGPGGKGAPGGFDEHDWEGAEELSEAEKEELAREIDRALRQGQIAAQKLCGKGAGGMDREIGDLLKPKVNWRDELREFVKSACNAKDTSSWRRVNRRLVGEGIYMPTLIGERVQSLCIGVDTSGSIGQEELRIALSEIKGIVDMVHPEKIELLYWDTEVAGHETYTEGNMDAFVSSTKPRGGGGTDPTCMIPYMKENQIDAQCIIQITDGCIGDWGKDWKGPILWVICGQYGENIQAPIGKSIHIGSEDW